MFFDQEQMIFFPETLPPDFKFEFSYPFEEINLQVKGAAISALHFKASDSKGVVLYFHGNAGNLESWGGVAAEFLSRSYDLFIIDYRGYGKSTGRILNEQMLHDDARAIYQFLREKFREDHIVLYGRSIGTGIACRLARDNNPKMLILESPYFSLKEIAHRFIPIIPKAFLDATFKYPMRTDLWISDVRCPIFIFHGTLDEVIPFDASPRLLKLIKSRHELIAIPGGAHNDLINYDLYHEALDRILNNSN